MRLRSLVAVALVLLGVGSAFGFSDPPFDRERLEWRATHVVVARLDWKRGELVVLESWRGDLARGARAPLGDLAPLGSATWRGIQPGAHRASGERAVLYLRREGERLVPADPAHLSCIWLEGGKSYAFDDGRRLIDLGRDELRLRAACAKADDSKASLASASLVVDPVPRSIALVALRGTMASSYGEAALLEELQLHRAEGVGELRKLLAKKSLLEEHGAILYWIRELDPWEALDDARAIVRDEAALWKTLAPRLGYEFAVKGHLDDGPERDELLAHLRRIRIALKCGADGPEATQLRAVVEKSGLEAYERNKGLKSDCDLL